jgi:alpha-mannosidase
MICLCQFHDCLPGTSIEMCYDDSDQVSWHAYMGLPP